MATYVLGALCPWPGVHLRELRLLAGPLGQAHAPTAPMLMLAFLLFVAGLGVKLDELRKVLHRPRLLIGGLAANVIYPIAITVALSAALSGWHNGDEAQSILVGLAIIGAMPIAGSSTAWSENVDGNLVLSLGLVWTSTLAKAIVCACSTTCCTAAVRCWVCGRIPALNSS